MGEEIPSRATRGSGTGLGRPRGGVSREGESRAARVRPPQEAHITTIRRSVCEVGDAGGMV